MSEVLDKIEIKPVVTKKRAAPKKVNEESKTDKPIPKLKKSKPDGETKKKASKTNYVSEDTLRTMHLETQKQFENWAKDTMNELTKRLTEERATTRAQLEALTNNAKEHHAQLGTRLTSDLHKSIQTQYQEVLKQQEEVKKLLAEQVNLSKSQERKSIDPKSTMHQLPINKYHNFFYQGFLFVLQHKD